jgi:hypothetical protein
MLGVGGQLKGELADTTLSVYLVLGRRPAARAQSPSNSNTECLTDCNFWVFLVR